MTLFCHTTSNAIKLLIIGLSSYFLASLTSCSTGQGRKPRMAEGSISYPFVRDTKPVGRAKEKQPFVIRSATGSSEYSVEIPDNASRYDIQIPLAELAPKGSIDSIGRSSQDGKPLNPGTTDKELVSALPSLSKNRPQDTALMDAAFGVGSPEGPVQSPSYSIGIARVNQYYKERNFELALVELNNILAFYPNSPKLLKMKGTLLMKTGNRELAMKAWQRALDLAPQDLALQKSINRLNERITMEQNIRSPITKRDLPISETPTTSSPTSLDTSISSPTPEQILDSTTH